MNPRRRLPRRLVAAAALVVLALTGCVPGPDDASGDTDETSEPTTVSTEATSSTVPPDASSTTSEPTTTEAPDPPASVAFVSSFDPDVGSDLYRLSDGSVEPVTALAFAGSDDPVQLTDIAVSSEGELYGSTFDQLVRVDSASGTVEPVAFFSQGPVNALTFLPDGRLLAADLEGRVSIVDIETGVARTVATYPTGQVSSGDLAVAADGTVYAATTTSVNEFLVSIDTVTGEVEILSSVLPLTVYGLIPDPGGGLLGLIHESTTGDCSQGELVELDTSGGTEHRSITCLDFGPGGAAS